MIDRVELESLDVSYLLTIGSDAKTVLGEQLGYLTAIQYLAPAEASMIANMCKYASAGCTSACLFTAGRAAFDSTIGKARIKRTKLFVRHKPVYWARMIRELDGAQRKANRENKTLVVRLNGTSDQLWERMKIKGTRHDGLTLMEAYPDTQMYDYSKWPFHTRPNLPGNYHLTYSYSEDTTESELRENIANGRNVAIVFNCCQLNNRGRCFTKCKCPLPTEYMGIPVVSGDDSDLRFLDQPGVIIGLHAKGQARNDTSGFVVNT